MKYLLIILISLAFITAVLSTPVVYAEPANIEGLQQRIEEKNEELQTLQGEREELEQKLEEVEGQSDALTSELSRIKYQIDQLNVSIRTNRLVIEKLGLETQSLNEEITDTEQSIEQSKKTIGKLLIELQQRDHESFLVIFLKNSSLAESVSEIQSIMTLGNTLTNNVTQLRGFQNKLARKVSEVQTRKWGIEVEQKTLVNSQYIVEDHKDEKQFLLAQTKSQERIYEEKIAELDKKQDEISAIITGIEEQLRKSFDPTLLPIKRPGVIAYPVQGEPLITQCYGETEFAERAYRTKFHTGLDLRARLGAPILAAADGVVKAVDNNDRGITRWLKYQYGRYVLIDHDNNLSTLYAHLSRHAVAKGDIVKQGDIIGYSGNTGYSFGSHLHLGLYWTPSIQLKKIEPAAGLVPVGVTIDPLDYLPIIGNAKNCR